MRLSFEAPPGAIKLLNQVVGEVPVPDSAVQEFDHDGPCAAYVIGTDLDRCACATADCCRFLATSSAMAYTISSRSPEKQWRRSRASEEIRLSSFGLSTVAMISSRGTRMFTKSSVTAAGQSNEQFAPLSLSNLWASLSIPPSLSR